MRLTQSHTTSPECHQGAPLGGGAVKGADVEVPAVR